MFWEIINGEIGNFGNFKNFWNILPWPRVLVWPKRRFGSLKSIETKTCIICQANYLNSENIFFYYVSVVMYVHYTYIMFTILLLFILFFGPSRPLQINNVYYLIWIRKNCSTMRKLTWHLSYQSMFKVSLCSSGAICLRGSRPSVTIIIVTWTTSP